MKISLNKRLKIERIWVFLGLALLAVAALLLALAFLGPRFASLERSSTSSLSSTPAGASPTISSSSSTPETASTTDTSDTAPPGSTSTTEPLAASVNGYAITQSYLSETVRLNLVLGELSGTSTMSEEETLQRLIRSQLILQGVEDLEEPTQQDIESFISGLQGSWGVSDEVVVEMLQGVGLDRSFLEDTIQRLLTVEAGVETLQDQGHSIAEWLSEQEQDADITVFGDALGEEEAEVSPTTPDPVQTDTPGPTPASQSEIPEIAPDFTLSRAGGGSFTLMDQLDKGPVVLVFFEKCGWGSDRTQLVQLREQYAAFQDAGAEVVALAVSPLSDVEERVLGVVNPPYPLLADPNHQVAEAFNVYDLLGTGYATPSVFIIDTDGDIAWSYVGQTSTDRPSAISVLEHLP